VNNWKFAIPAVVVAALLLVWYAFRPERLVVNRYVNEPFPASESGTPEAIASGRFQTVDLAAILTNLRTFWKGDKKGRLTTMQDSNGIYLEGLSCGLLGSHQHIYQSRHRSCAGLPSGGSASFGSKRMELLARIQFQGRQRKSSSRPQAVGF
jgi:hypothetical protein